MLTQVARTISVSLQEGKEGLKYATAFGEELNQTYTRGAPLVRDASTKELEEWAGGTDASLIVGFAASDASETAGTAVGYYEANDTFIGEGTLIDGTDAVALAASHIETEYSLVKSGNNWLIDVADTTTPIVKVIEAVDAVGDYNARVKFRVLRDKQANQGDAA
jgi:hypothetical protein